MPAKQHGQVPKTRRCRYTSWVVSIVPISIPYFWALIRTLSEGCSNALWRHLTSSTLASSSFVKEVVRLTLLLRVKILNSCLTWFLVIQGIRGHGVLSRLLNVVTIVGNWVIQHCLWGMGRWNQLDSQWYIVDIDPEIPWIGVSGKELVRSSHDSSVKMWRLTPESRMHRGARETLVSVVMVMMFMSSSGPFSKVSSGSNGVLSGNFLFLPRYIPPSALKVLRREEGCEKVCPVIFYSSMARDG